MDTKYKNIFKFLLLTTITLLSACKTELDFTPTAAVSSASITESDYAALLTGVYNGAQGLSMGLPYVAQDIAADNIKARTWAPLIEMDNNSISTSNSYVYGWWNAFFKNVQLSNNLIAEVSKHEQTTYAKQIIAQARLLRAWNYLQIVSLWGDAPIVTEVTSELLSRSSEKEVWKFIKEDCEYALENAPNYTSPSYVSKIAAKAFLARVLLISPSGVQDKTRAAQLAEEVIADGTFVLASNFADIWQAKTSKEIILQWKNTSTDSYSPGWFLRSNLVNSVSSPGAGDLGRYELPVDTAFFYHAFEAGDNRKNASIRYLKTTSSKTWDCIKYPSYDGSDPWPVIRIAEMYLISAEAQGYPNGVSRLNDLRAKRGLTSLVAGTDITSDNFLNRIFAERRVEFFCEGQRFYDLRRWYNSGEAGKKAVLALRKYQTGEAAGSRLQASETMNIADDGSNLLFPVPATAIANDPNLFPNNPGY